MSKINIFNVIATLFMLVLVSITAYNRYNIDKPRINKKQLNTMCETMTVWHDNLGVVAHSLHKELKKVPVKKDQPKKDNPLFRYKRAQHGVVKNVKLELKSILEDLKCPHHEILENY